MNNQPEALRLAEEGMHMHTPNSPEYIISKELRRLHEVNQELVDELTEMLSWQSLAPEHVVLSAKAVLTKATGESNA